MLPHQSICQYCGFKIEELTVRIRIEDLFFGFKFLLQTHLFLRDESALKELLGTHQSSVLMNIILFYTNVFEGLCPTECRTFHFNDSKRTFTS